MLSTEKHLPVILSSVLIAVLSYTALTKWMDLETFRYQMLNQPLPSGISEVLVWLLPPMELAIAALLLFRETRYYGFIGATFLMLLFTGYIALILIGSFEQVPCSCGGILASLTWEQHLVVNLVLTGIAMGGWVVESRGLRAESSFAEATADES